MTDTNTLGDTPISFSTSGATIVQPKKKSKLWLIILIIVIVLIICCVITYFVGTQYRSQLEQFAGITPTPTVTVANTVKPTVKATAIPITGKRYKAGDQVVFGDVSVTAYSIMNNVDSEIAYFKPDAGYQFATVDVKVAFSGTGNFTANSLDFSLQDQQNNTYSAEISVKSPDLGVVLLNPGENTRGWITFQIPAKATNLTLVFTPTDDAGTTQESVAIDLF